MIEKNRSRARADLVNEAIAELRSQGMDDPSELAKVFGVKTDAILALMKRGADDEARHVKCPDSL